MEEVQLEDVYLFILSRKSSQRLETIFFYMEISEIFLIYIRWHGESLYQKELINE